MHKIKKAVCYGEVLWDAFPTHKKIGGAPLNVALRLKSFGLNTSLISRVGDDDNGKEIAQFLESGSIDITALQTDNVHKTGEVTVTLNEKGSALYDIQYPAAWDRIVCNEDIIAVVSQSDVFIFGSLISRDTTSRTTLLKLLKVAPFKVFDVNLRPPHYTMDLIENLMNIADFIKFNDDELFEICESLGSVYESLEENIRFIAEKTNTSQICVTKGEHGAVLLFENQFYYNSGYQVQVVDTVGAGDSFLATLIVSLLMGTSSQAAIDRACAMGALVANSAGANPAITKEEMKEIMKCQT
ncbi:MAG: carbohydrate kinase [Bacteroidales bacterium]|nr:carbohydrate kinase [Bacteroidales bacterium]